MTDPQHPHPAPHRPAASQAWAPWWIYLIVLLGANYLRTYLLPGSMSVLAVAVIAIVQAAVLFVLVTALWRATRPAQG